MPRKDTIERRLDAYVMHAHIGKNALADYGQLFTTIQGQTVSQRQLVLGQEQIIQFPEITIDGDRVKIVAYEGDRDTPPIIYNTNNSKVRSTRLAADEIIATRTHAIFDVKTRKVVVEYNQRGAKTGHFEQMLVNVGSRLHGNTFVFNTAPIPGEAFLKELKKFKVVKLASVKMIRPNTNFNDAEDKLTKEAEKSDAGMIELTMHAQRNSSLSFGKGILASIVNLVKSPKPSIKDITITGSTEDSDLKSSLHYLGHCKQTKKVFKRGQDGLPESNDVWSGLETYLGELNREVP